MAESWTVLLSRRAGDSRVVINPFLVCVCAKLQAALISYGAPSAGIVWRTLEVQALPGSLPAQMVKPQNKLTVLLDDASASQLTLEDWTDWKKYPRSNIPKPAKN